MPSLRVYGILERMYVAREEQKVEDLTLELWGTHSRKAETESQWERVDMEQEGREGGEPDNVD